MALNKVMEYLGLVDGPVAAPAVEDKSGKRLTRESRSVPLSPIAQQAGVTVLGGPRSIAVELAPEMEPSYNIITLHPRSYSEARQMAEHYRQGNPVIINLDDMDESERKRLVDFASGLAFGLQGGIERIASRVFLISPANVSVRTEDKAAFAQASFFNQS